MSAPGNIIDLLTKRSEGVTQRVSGLESDLAASRDREGEARLTQDVEMAPARGKLREQLEAGAPAPPEMAPMPKAPMAPQMDAKEMTETLSLITALAAFSGALTRQPLTAALNNFSAGVKGLVTGNELAFKDSIKEFETNLQKARNENESTWKRYQAAQSKYKTDIVGLQNELKLIAAETQSPIDLEMATRGDIVSLYKAREQAESNFDKVVASVAKMKAAQDRHSETLAETKRHHEELEKEAGAREKRLAAGKGGAGAQDKLTKEFQDKARALHTRHLREYDKAAGDPKRLAELDRRYKDQLSTLEAEMRSRGFAGKLTSGVGSPPAPGAAGAPAPSGASAAPPPSAGKYKSADDVKAAFEGGKLTREEALATLKRDFGYE